jgi:GDP-4-dehydro-6-deoxy-D-mannose reductase
MERDPEIGALSVGDLSAVRDFLDIRDICSALECLAQKGRTGEIYNVCSQRGVTIKRVLSQMLRSSLRKKIMVREDERRDRGVSRSVGSCAKLKKATGWCPRYAFAQSAADTLAYYRSIAGAC